MPIKFLFMFKQVITVTFLFSSLFSFSQVSVGGNSTINGAQLNAITTAMPFLSINPDSRSGAMGDAGTALSPNPSAVYWNTASIVFSQKNSEVGISYVPWLRQLTNDIHLSYVSGYKKIGERQAFTGALRYFSLGNITFTNNDGQVTRDFNPNEFELIGGYAFKLSDRMSIGLNGKFAYSNLTGGSVVPGAQTKPGVAGIADISFMYQNKDLRINGKNATYAFGATINNIGNKVSYSSAGSGSDFIPTNLKIGSALQTEMDAYNKFTVSLDLQKLLVPTPPIYSGGSLIAGKDNNVGVIAGMIQSFYDAPGVVSIDASNKVILDSEGKAQVEKGSVLKEELSEINIAAGLEYNYNKVLAIRGGYFHESTTKGGRQFFTFGVGLKYNVIGFDISYIAPLKRNNPLANTMRFSITFDLGGKTTKSND